MVQTLSLVGAAFAVGGSYFAVDSLRDILLAKTINTSYATRIAFAGAATLAGLAMISSASATQARKNTKNRLSKQLMSAESCVSCETPDRYYVGGLCSDSGEMKCISCCSCDNCHNRWSQLEVGEMQGAESFSAEADDYICKCGSTELRYVEYDDDSLNGFFCMNCSLSPCGVSETDDKPCTCNLDEFFHRSKSYDAEAYDHRTERAWSGMLSNAPGDAVVNRVDLFHDKHILAHDDAHRAAQSWLRKNEKDQFNEIHYMLYQIDAGKWGMEYLALDTMDAEELTFHDWSNQEMMNHGKDDSFEDWVEHEIDSHGNVSLQEWGDHEQESHTKRYGHSRPRGAFTARDAETAYSMIQHQDDKCLEAIADSLRDQYGLGPIDGFFEWDQDSDGNITLGIYDDDENRLDKIVYDRKSLTEALKKVGYRNPESWGAELYDPSDMTCHLCEKDGSKRGGLVTGHTGVAVCEMCLDEVEERDAESKRYTRRPIDRFTRKPKAKAGAYRSRGRRSALKSMFASEDSDDDDDTDLVPDRDPRRGAPDLWFAEGNSKKTFPPIFKKATTGKIQEWRIRTEELPDGNWAYISSHGQLGGSMVEGKGTVIKAGKQGRTVEEQANAEAAAKWKKKKETGYFESADEASNNVVVLPMTALNFKKRAHDINWPAIGQPKLDGVRCLARLEADGTVSLTSRKNKLFPGMDHIREELATRLTSLGNSEGSPFPSNIVVDGELYADPEELTFQQSTGVVRRNNKTPEDLEDEKKIKLNVYDCINLDDPDMDFIDRHNLMVNSLSNMDSIAIVDNTTLSDTDAVDPLHDKFVTQGYEGLMIRNVKGPYKLNGKSKHLQKYKSFQDDEFKIVGYTEGKGDYVGTVIWICETSDGKQFRVKPNGTHAYRSKLFDEADSHIGKEITVRFFELTDGGLPRHPTGGWFRDYEAETFDAESSKHWDESSRTMWDQSEVTDPDELVRLGKIFKVGNGNPEGWKKYLDEFGPFVYVTKDTRPWALWQPGSKEAVVRFNNRGKIRDNLHITDIQQLYGIKSDESFGAEGAPTADEKCDLDYHLRCHDCRLCLDCNLEADAGGNVCRSCTGESIERFDAFSISDRPVSVSFGKGTSGNAKMKAVFTDGSGDTKTTQFGYKGMSDYTKHGDDKRKSSYLARHGAKSSGQKWNDPTTAGSLSRWVLWNKKSLSESKKSFKNKFNLGAEGNYESPIEEEGYQQSIFITEAGRRSVWAYEPDYSITEDSI